MLGRTTERESLSTRGESYEAEGSERCSTSLVSLPSSEWWSGLLSVPTTGRVRILFLHFERHGTPPADSLGGTRMTFSLPKQESGAVLALFGGIVAQAERAGVLQEPSIAIPLAPDEAEASDA
jgi:hypothetical protein